MEVKWNLSFAAMQAERENDDDDDDDVYRLLRSLL